MTKNLINVVVVSSCVSLSVSVQGEVVKGWVRRWSRPSLPDVVAEYEKSSSKSLYASELEIVKRQRECGIDRIEIPVGAMVEIQTLPDFKTICRVPVDAKGGYTANVPLPAKACRVYCRVDVEEFGRSVRFVGASRLEWDRREKAFKQDIDMRRDCNTIVGKCIDTNGSPIANADVQVRLVWTPTHEEFNYDKWSAAKTNARGEWQVDGVGVPNMERLLKYYCDTNTVNVCYDTAEPLLIRIDVQGEVGPRKSTASATVPNVSAERRIAIEKALEITEKRTKTEIPKACPLEYFPVSTNNVIYVPDIVLK